MKTLIAIVYLLLCSSLLIAQDLAHISKPKPIQLRSGFSLQSNWYQVNGISPRQPGFSWFLSGTPVLEVYGMAVPFQFTLSNHHQRIQQPFNQFGINPQYKWAKLHLGYSSMRFSPFTLSNYRFFGLGTSLNPGKLRFGALYGRFQKAVSKTNSLTGLEGEYFNTHAIPAFERKAFGIKLGIGSERNYVDLIFLKGKDEPTSAEIEETPTENAVVGLSCQLTFFKKLIWKTDLAASAFTRDQFSDSLAMGTFSGQSLVSKIILPRATSQILTAGETSLNFRGKYLQLGLKYRRVDPDYKSMGAYYFQTDVEQWLFSPSFSSKNRKWFLSGSIGRERNNLYQQRPVTTTRLIGSANLNWNASRNFGLNAQYSNFGISQNPLASNLSDTTLLEQIAQNFSLVPRVNWQGHGSSHSLSFALRSRGLSIKRKNLRNSRAVDSMSGKGGAL